jgi:putative membrane protein
MMWETKTAFSHIVRFIVATIVLKFVGYLVPGFSLNGWGTAFITAAIITAIGLIAEAMLGAELSPYGRGVTGFISAAIIIFLAGYMVEGVQVSILGALLAALVIGIIDLFLPTPARFWKR